MSEFPPHVDASPTPTAFAPMRRRVAAVAGGTLSALATAAILAPPAGAAVEHTVVSGETLSSIAAANGYDASALASWNGISAETYVVEGQTLQVPTADEAAAAGLTTATATSPDTTTTTASSDPTVAPTEPAAPAPASWLAPVQTLEGTGYLDAGVAAAWEQMRQDALANYGVDLMPAGTLSVYRSSEQQSYLYDLFLSGIGAPANPPGSSAHERGVAVDVASEDMAAVVSEIGPNYGFVQTTEEWWHFEWTG
ncbi:LysM peptidoglycan-binding domain-containing protein [Thermoleophilia bacterium SCSIO 60948]|nr:LysM peptidoglycan-binding domain-containing protein [Thermoleophilia bacterium SCSIO 60948]